MENVCAFDLRDDLGWGSGFNMPTHLPLFLLRTKVRRLGPQAVRFTLTRRNLLESLHTESANNLRAECDPTHASALGLSLCDGGLELAVLRLEAVELLLLQHVGFVQSPGLF